MGVKEAIELLDQEIECLREETIEELFQIVQLIEEHDAPKEVKLVLSARINQIIWDKINDIQNTVKES